jgi:DNA-binding response OmpR family regulator
MKTVLVIEDEAQTRNIFLQCLEFEGFRALGAENGKWGIKLAQHHHPDLVVCDIMMPDIDGYSVLSTLRKSQRHGGHSAHIFDGKSHHDGSAPGMEFGADDYLTKPCTVEQFLTAINTRLKRQAQLAQFISRNLRKRLLRRPSQQLAHAVDSETSRETDIFPDCPKLAAVFHFIEENFHRSINLSDVAQRPAILQLI